MADSRSNLKDKPTQTVWEAAMMVVTWVTRLIYLNILWILFIALGLVVLGIFPATAGMFAVTRQWIKCNETTTMFRTFWTTYRECFLNCNLIALMAYVVGFILYVDWKVSIHQSGQVWSVDHALTMLLIIAYVSLLANLFPVVVHYQVNALSAIRQTALFIIFRPIRSLMVTLLFCLEGVFVTVFHGLVPMLSMSSVSFAMMFVAYRTFIKADGQPKDDVIR